MRVYLREEAKLLYCLYEKPKHHLQVYYEKTIKASFPWCCVSVYVCWQKLDGFVCWMYSSDLKRGIDKIMSHQAKEQEEQHHSVHLPHRYSHHGKG